MLWTANCAGRVFHQLRISIYLTKPRQRTETPIWAKWSLPYNFDRDFMFLASVTVTKRGYAGGLTGKLSSAFKQSAIPAASGLDDLARSSKTFFTLWRVMTYIAYCSCEETIIEISGTHEQLTKQVLCLVNSWVIDWRPGNKSFIGQRVR